jgi:hypothetical protein
MAKPQGNTVDAVEKGTPQLQCSQEIKQEEK